MSEVLWSSPQQLAQVAVSVAAVYLVGLFLVRIAGRRTLAEISAYDVLVTIAIGSILANAALPAKSTIADAVLAIAVLLTLQVGIGALRLRVPRIQRVLDFQPMAIVREGRFRLSDSPLSPQLSQVEVEELLRREGITDVTSVQLVVLEPSGKVSVFATDADGGLTRRFLGEDGT